jgi:K+-transporting ATPase ATPase C chain
MRFPFVAQLTASVRNVAVMTLALGVAYPLVMTAFAQVAVDDRADGQLLEVDGELVGSRLIGQEFTAAEYFHSRPSAAGFDAAAGTGSNYGPTNSEYLDAVAASVAEYRSVNDVPDDVAIPVDAVTASGSGLDPHISPANARLQAPRVAAARGIELDQVLDLVEHHTVGRPLGILGDDAVNVVELNIELDQVSGSAESS